MAWPCFLVTPTDRERRSLRRYSGYRTPEGTPRPTVDRLCPASGTSYHNTHARIEDGPHGEGHTLSRDWPRDDPRWPIHCTCGYAFRDDDEWQLFCERVFVAPDGTEHVLHGQVAPGLMVDATWLHGVTGYGDRSPDGMVLMLYLPGGVPWIIDGPASGGGHWERTGVPPAITVLPSIASPGYHGWLTDGELSADLEGRTYS